MEMKTVELFLSSGIHAVEAAAYVSLTPAVVLFRAPRAVQRSLRPD
jgi:hypothetical protein